MCMYMYTYIHIHTHINTYTYTIYIFKCREMPWCMLTPKRECSTTGTSGFFRVSCGRQNPVEFKVCISRWQSHGAVTMGHQSEP